MSIINSQPRIGAAGQSTGFKIERSLRFNSADSAYLNRTPASAGNKKTWTLSCWVKRSNIGVFSPIFTAATIAPRSNINFRSDDTIEFRQLTSSETDSTKLITTQVFRDVGAWYHLVFVQDTTQATSSNRAKMYVNGVQVTAFSTATYPSQDFETLGINNNVVHEIGRYASSTGDGSFPGYMTEVNFIDGSALTPSSFGETDTDTGVWKPKAYSGSYGTNGFYLKFADNSGTTSTTLGKDSSGNGNNWTPNNFSVTAGAGNDSLVDTPTPYGTDTGAGGEVRGNYCTLNPLSTTAGTYTQGNLRYVGAAAYRRSNATISLSTGKWYWEVTLGNAPFSPRGVGSQYNAFGFGLSTVFNSTTNPNAVTDAVVLADNAYYKNFSGSWTDSSISFSSGDVLSIAVDLDANSFTFYRNNSQVTTGTIGGTAGRELVPIIISYDGSYGVMDANFGQRPFAYTAPSGFKALCTQNLPTPTIGATATTRADDYFNTVLYTGNATSRSISGVGFQPDFVWIKNRSSADWNHVLFDRVRGATYRLLSNLTNAEDTGAGYGVVTSFDSDGFSIDTGGNVNNNTNAFVSWNWKANGAGSSNTQGTITSTVSANTTAGFSVVTYTGNGTTGATVGHGLGVKPSMMIFKGRTNAVDWVVYHTSLGATKNLKLNLTDAEATQSGQFNDTEPTSTLFTLGANSPVNANTVTYVAYCFAAVAGYSAFGSYTGNGSTDGPFVYTGFRPAFFLIKLSSGSGQSWWIYDKARNTFNALDIMLSPNNSIAEVTSSQYAIDFLSNGIKIRTLNDYINASGSTYVYACFAENPFKYSLAR